MKREHQEVTGGSAAGGGCYSGKSKQVEEDAGEDELLAALGYNVRSSAMADVAQKLEQLEMVMGNVQDDGLSLLGSDTIHYNPSDLANWIESMLSELNAPPGYDNWAVVEPGRDDAESSSGGQNSEFPEKSTQLRQAQMFDSSDYDLKAAVSGTGVVYTNGVGGRGGKESSSLPSEKKRLKSEHPQQPEPAEARPVFVVDSQENGIRLVHTLMACAEAIQQDNHKAAEALVKQISMLAISQAGAMRKVATYFADALAMRIYRLYPQDPIDSLSDLLQMHFYETCPYLKFAHFTANQAILEAFAGQTRVHVIDFSMKQGMQWPALMQALALRPGGPPTFRLTGIGPPQPDNTDALQQVGWKLAQFAKTIHVEFEYRGFVVNSLADLDAYMLDIRADVEAVAVNSIFELHRLLAQPGAIDKVLSTVRAMRPRIVTLVEQEAKHNGPVFLDRFTEALHYYSTMFDSLEGCGISPTNIQDQVMSEVYLGRQICNVVACEGVDRVERHETLPQWRSRMNTAGFSPVHLGSNAFKQASMLLALFAGGDGYRVEENNGCLMLGWHTRPLIATSAWQISLQ